MPWSIAFLPGDGPISALVTLRDSGEVLLVDGAGEANSLGQVPGVAAAGEGGLLGAAVSPDFDQDGRVFFYLTTAGDNRVVTADLDGSTLSGFEPILTAIPQGATHNGGRIAFGPDGHLYVATGDAGVTDNSQDPDSLGGKILRVTADGDPTPGNPTVGSAVYSLGHRNVQGLAWTEDGTLVASEFGANTFDELNVIVPGGNYGWPAVEGEGGEPEYIDPIVQWPTDQASPSGIAVGEDGAVYMAALRGQTVWRIPLEGEGEDTRGGEPESLYPGEFGRVRDVVRAPDDRLWILTSNSSRGAPGPEDDRVIILGD